MAGARNAAEVTVGHGSVCNDCLVCYSTLIRASSLVSLVDYSFANNANIANIAKHVVHATARQCTPVHR
jgi:hypothetical protein